MAWKSKASIRDGLREFALRMALGKPVRESSRPSPICGTSPPPRSPTWRESPRGPWRTGESRERGRGSGRRGGSVELRSGTQSPNTCVGGPKPSSPTPPRASPEAAGDRLQNPGTRPSRRRPSPRWARGARSARTRAQEGPCSSPHFCQRTPPGSVREVYDPPIRRAQGLLASPANSLFSAV